MPIKLEISPRLIQSVASLYNDVNRIFMEYIDNSLDNAEQFYDEATNEYSKQINISIIVQGEGFKEGTATILDNCFGITNFKKVVQSVGNSDKKAQPWTNGQFGYGIYSFMAACSKLEISSKITNGKCLYIPIKREQFDKDKQEDVEFPDPQVMEKFDYDSGTKISLSNFEKFSWKQIDIKELKNEIEKHFELLLSRKNLKIKLIVLDSYGNKKEDFLCKRFFYDQFEGDVWEDYKSEFVIQIGRKQPKPMKVSSLKPVHVFLKITHGKEINKRPVFICKGRRIGEIKEIKSFRSNRKSELWDHPNVTGYIDVSDFLEPTIARNDFQNGHKSKALFNYMIEIEPLILDEIKKVNQKSEEKHYKELEDRLTQALSKLAKLDQMIYRSAFLPGGQKKLEDGGQGQDLEDNGEEEVDDIVGNQSNNKEKRDTVPLPEDKPQGESKKDQEEDNPFEDGEYETKEKRKSGFNINITERDPDIDAATEKPLRSILANNEIIIFKQHPEFQKRVESSRRGETRITQRLITYLAGEITVHYKDKFHTKKGTQPEYSKSHFSDLVDFIYQFEDLLKDLSGKNLSDLSK